MRTFTDTPIFGLTPFSVMHVNPGETLRGPVGQFMRFQPFIAPMMNRFYLHNWFFYVPYRLLWDKWEQLVTDVLMTGDSDLFDSFPTCYTPTWLFSTHNSKDSTFKSGAFPLYAYNKIWNTFFRDEEIFKIEKDDIDKSSDLLTEVPEDYDWQYGSRGTESKAKRPKSYQASIFRRGFVSMYKTPESTLMTEDISATEMQYKVELQATEHSKAITDRTKVKNDLLGSFVENIIKYKRSDAREAFMLARRQNIDNLYGLNDYRELMNSIGGYVSREKVDQPELLYHSSRMLVMDDSIVTSNTGLGEIGGFMVGTKRNRFPSRKFNEHGIVMGLMAIRPEIFYNGFLDEVNIKPNKRTWWFGDTFPDTYQPTGKKFEYDSGIVNTFGKIDGAYRTCLDQFRKPGDQVNSRISVATLRKSPSGTPVAGQRGSYDPFLLYVEDCTKNENLRDPTTLDKTRLNSMTEVQITGKTILNQDSNPDFVRPVAVVKTDLKLSRISPIKPVAKLFTSKTMG